MKMICISGQVVTRVASYQMQMLVDIIFVAELINNKGTGEQENVPR